MEDVFNWFQKWMPPFTIISKSKTHCNPQTIRNRSRYSFNLPRIQTLFLILKTIYISILQVS